MLFRFKSIKFKSLGPSSRFYTLSHDVLPLHLDSQKDRDTAMRTLLSPNLHMRGVKITVLKAAVVVHEKCKVRIL